MNHVTRLAVTAALLGTTALSQAAITLEPIGRYQGESAKFDRGAAEIVAYDSGTQRIFVVNAQDATVDVLDASDPSNLSWFGQINVKAIPGLDPAKLGAANSVAVRDGLVAVAVEASPITDPGLIAFYDAESLELLKTVAAGSLPDAVTFSNTGHYVVASNEGEPAGGVNPEGSVTVVDVRVEAGVRAYNSCTANFQAFNSRRDELIAAGVKIDPGATVAQDLEPEYAAAQGDNAYVTLQENNAVAVIKMNQCRVQRIMPLGVKNHGLAENSLDTSDREISSSKGRIELRTWQNLHGLYEPDSIAAYEADDRTLYLVVANEGDVRDPNNARIKDLPLDPTAFPPSLDVKSDKNLGRLNVVKSLGDTDGDGDYDRLYAYGARSFSIYTNDGRQVYDSANDFESIIANLVGSGDLAPQAFNSTSTSNYAGTVPGESNNSFDSRSDDKGPEPEGVAVGRVGDRTYAFIGLERIGGIVVYDVTDPADAFYVDYVNNRDFSQGVCTEVNIDGTCKNATPNPDALDLGPEGLAFVPAGASPNGKPLLVVGNEISGSTTVYEVATED
jgi:hypothetical protein